MEIIERCPICDGTTFNEFLQAEDYFLTKEIFFIVQCDHCGFKLLNPRPDKDGILKYYESPEYISHGSKKGDILGFFYSIIRKYAIRRKRILIERFALGRKLLDIGCGTGDFIANCEHKGWDVSGIEPATKAREYAINKHGLKVTDEMVLDKFLPNSFDVITLWHVIEHVHDLKERLIAIRQLLSEQGLLVVAVPNCDSWDAQKYQRHWAAYDLPRHLHHFNKETIIKLIENHGFELMDVSPMKYDAFYICLLSEKYSTGKIKYFSALINGLTSNFHAKTHDLNYSSHTYFFKPQNKPK